MKKIQLILNPCSQQWDNMQPDASGRYCESCEKHIVDLTTKSDLELIEFFKKKKDNICGRLSAGQLNRELVLPALKNHWHWLLPLAVGAIAVSPAAASELRPVAMVGNQTAFSPQNPIPSIATKAVKLDTIRGSVVDDLTGKPLKGVKIRQKGFGNVLAVTDSIGKFELAVTATDLATAYTFDLLGYGQSEVGLVNDIVIKLAVEKLFILGMVSPISLNRNPLYVVSVGKKSCTMDALKVSEIPADWIEKLEVLKDAKAAAIYGSKGANGVIMIEIKKEYAKKINFSQKK